MKGWNKTKLIINVGEGTRRPNPSCPLNSNVRDVTASLDQTRENVVRGSSRRKGKKADASLASLVRFFSLAPQTGISSGRSCCLDTQSLEIIHLYYYDNYYYPTLQDGSNYLHRWDQELHHEELPLSPDPSAEKAPKPAPHATAPTKNVQNQPRIWKERRTKVSWKPWLIVIVLN